MLKGRNSEQETDATRCGNHTLKKREFLVLKGCANWPKVSSVEYGGGDWPKFRSGDGRDKVW